MTNYETELKARLGETVIFWNRGKVDFEIKPHAAMVIGVGLNMRLDLCVFLLGPIQGGGRLFSHIQGAYPGDTNPTSDQMYDSGSWIPAKMYHAEMDRREKAKKEREDAEAKAKLAEKEAANKPPAKSEKTEGQGGEGDGKGDDSTSPPPPPPPVNPDGKESGRKIQSVKS